MLQSNGRQRLDRDFPVERQIDCQIHDARSARPDEPLDLELALDVQRQCGFHRRCAAGAALRGGSPHRMAFGAALCRFVFPVRDRLLARSRSRERGTSFPQLAVLQLEGSLTGHRRDQHAVALGVGKSVDALTDTDDTNQRSR